MNLNRKIDLEAFEMVAPARSPSTALLARLAVPCGLSLACGVALTVALFSGSPRAVADEDDEITGNMASVAPMRSLLARVHAAYPGRVLAVELERDEHGNEDVWVYEVKLLTDRGSVLKLDYDAVHLELLDVKGRPEK